jgi:hypothetical protein
LLDPIRRKVLVVSGGGSQRSRSGPKKAEYTPASLSPGLLGLESRPSLISHRVVLSRIIHGHLASFVLYPGVEIRGFLWPRKKTGVALLSSMGVIKIEWNIPHPVVEDGNNKRPITVFLSFRVFFFCFAASVDIVSVKVE